MPLPLNRSASNKSNETSKVKPVSKVKPIVVTNPNDPRLKAYNDSNQNYKYNPYNRVKELEKLNYDYELEQKSGDWAYPLTRKPVQPVIYKKPTNNKPIIKKQKATEEQVKPLDKTPKLNKPERVELSMKKSESKPSSEGTEFKQGRKFMKETGLRPGFYKKDELAENSNKKIPIKRR